MNRLLAGLVGCAGGLVVGMLLVALLGPSFSELAAERDRLERENQELAGKLDEVTDEKRKLEIGFANMQKHLDSVSEFYDNDRTYLEGQIKQLRQKLAEKETGDERQSVHSTSGPAAIRPPPVHQERPPPPSPLAPPPPTKKSH